MFKAIRSRLQNKLILAFLFVVLVPTLFSIGYNLSVGTQQVLDKAKTDEISLSQQQATRVEDYLAGFPGEALFLSQSAAVQRYVNGVAANDAAMAQDGLGLTQTLFLAYVQNTGKVDKIRLLDTKGREIIRINYSDGKADITPEAGLQDKSDRPYFTESIILPKGRVYISPLDLNQENGQIEVPHKPVMRYATPVYSQDGKPGGIVVLTVLAENFLDFLRPDDPGEQAYLLDKDGYYLLAPAENLLFGRDLNTNITFATQNPHDAQEILTGKSEGVLAGSVDHPDVYTAFLHISPPGQEDAIQWTFIQQKPLSGILELENNQRNATLLLSGVAVLVALALGVIFTRSIVQPVRQLATTANLIGKGQRGVAVPNITSGDEIGQLAGAFDQMLSELNTIYGGLEARVAARTRDLETSAEIAAAANQVRDVSDLLSLTVNLIRDRFDFYYVQVYLIDASGKWAVLEDGTGYVGRKLLARQHRLPLDGRSIVAQTIRSGAPYVVQNTAQDATFLPNDLLPDTKAEIAVPLRSKTAIIGVLDIQHNQPNAFDEAAQQLYQTLADQLATTFENVKLFQQAEQRTQELQTVAEVSAAASSNLNLDDLLQNVSDLTKKRFNLYHAHVYLLDEASENLVLAAGAGEAGRTMKAEGRRIPLNHEHSLVARAGRERQGVIVNDVTQEADFLPNPLLPETKSEMAIPMTVGDTLIGVLDVQGNTINRFTDEDVRVKTTLAEQIAVAVSNARSFEQTQTAYQQTEALYQGSSRIVRTGSLDDTLHALVASTSLKQLDHVNIGFFNRPWEEELPENVTITALWERSGGQAMMPVGTTIPLEHLPATQFISRSKPFIINDAANDERLNANVKGLLQQLGIRSIVVFPLVVNDQWIGILTGQIKTIWTLSESEIRQISALTDQAATVIENLRLYEQTQAALEQTEALYQGSSQISHALSLHDVLHAMIENTDLQHTDRVNISFFDQPWQEQMPEGVTIAALWERNSETSVSPAGSHYSSKLFPFMAYVSREKPFIVENIETDPVLDQTTKSTLLHMGINSMMAFPLIVNGQWIGSLSAQRQDSHVLSEAQIRRISALTEQAATVIQNLRLYEQTQKALEQTESLYEGSRRLVGAATMNEVLDALVHSTALQSLDRSGIALFDRPWENEMPEMLTIVGVWEREGSTGNLPAGTTIPALRFPLIELFDAKGPLVVPDSETFPGLDDKLKELLKNIGMRSATIFPLIASGQRIGFVTGASSQPHTLSEDEIRQISALTDQAASIIQNAQLLDQMQRRAAELTIVAEVSAAATTILDVDMLLGEVVELTKERFQLYHAHIYLLDESGENLMLTAGAGEAGRIMREEKRFIPLNRQQSLVARAARQRSGVIVNDVTQEPGFLANPLLPDTQSEMAIPMVVGDKLVGVLDVQSEILNRFTEEDVQIETTLADQIAIAVNNARTFALTQEQAERERAVADKLRDVDRLKSQFLANMSHELRTPLNSIIGYSEVLIDGVDGDLPEEAVEDVEAIHDSGKHLLSLINEILDLAKIDAGQMQLDRKVVELPDIITEVIRAGQILLKDKPVTLEAVKEGEVHTVFADPIRLRQIMLNLVNNAIKFTEEGSVSIVYGLYDEKLAYIKVRDTGMGISEEGQKVVFERFRQVDGSSTRRAGGTGLGLSITQQLVHMHDGEIFLESEVGVGSTFWFTIPLAVVETT